MQVVKNYEFERVPDGPTFLTMVIKNTTSTDVNMEFDTTLPNPILQKPSDYVASIVRFTLPNASTPLLTWDDGYWWTTGLDNPPVYQYHAGVYHMRLGYNGTYITTEARMYRAQNENIDGTIPALHPPSATLIGPATPEYNFNYNYSSANRHIWEVQNLVDILNGTVEYMWTKLNGLVALPTADLPLFSYDETTQLFTVRALTSAYEASVATPITLDIDLPLEYMLQGISVKSLASSWYNILFKNRIMNVSGNYITNTQQGSSFDRWCDLKSIVFSSNLPARNEYYSASNADPSQPDVSNATFPILQDFSTAELAVDKFHNAFSYNSITPYRQVALLSDCPFYSINVTCSRIDYKGMRYPMQLPALTGADIKIMFTKRKDTSFI